MDSVRPHLGQIGFHPWNRTSSIPVSSSLCQGPHMPGPFGLLWELCWQFSWWCKRLDRFLLVCFPASGDLTVLTEQNAHPCQQMGALRHRERGLRTEKLQSFSLTFLTPGTLCWLHLHVKMLLIYVKRRTKYVPFYLWKFLLPLLIFPLHFVFWQEDVHSSTREPEKNPENLLNQHGN